jgi:hydroxypyruvate isomerase
VPRFAANLTMMFNEAPFLDRFQAAAEAGFDGVEFLFPYAYPANEIAERLAANGLTLALFNMPPGDFEGGERGIATAPDRFDEFARGVETAIAYARATGARRLHLMAGLADSADPASAAAYERSLAYAADALAPHEIDLLIEPINRRSMPGYFLHDFETAADFAARLARPNLKLQFDVFHRQILHGDVTQALRRFLPMVGHVQIASVPSRREPDGEELNFPFLFEELDRLGYTGWVGCEYQPRGRTEEGLGWFAPHRRRGVARASIRPAP